MIIKTIITALGFLFSFWWLECDKKATTFVLIWCFVIACHWDGTPEYLHFMVYGHPFTYIGITAIAMFICRKCYFHIAVAPLVYLFIGEIARLLSYQYTIKLPF